MSNGFTYFEFNKTIKASRALVSTGDEEESECNTREDICLNRSQFCSLNTRHLADN